MREILIAVGVLFTVGLISGGVLAIAARYMSVKSNERLIEIRESLPGINCGACGYNGCDGYAEALSNGDAAPNLCVPGGSDTAVKISALLGIDSVAVERRVAYVHCNGTHDVTVTNADYDGYRTCAAMCLACGGPNACKYGCLGCGDCASVCPTNAICVIDGVAKVEPSLCISCGKCVKTCPKQIISLIPGDAAVAISCSSHDGGAATRKRCTNGCIACRMCEKNCPTGAIKVINDLAVIDYKKCIGCGTCHKVCPVKCIESLVCE